ncbi:hypothetical protein S83_023274, partial [Arachis hypogaea]
PTQSPKSLNCSSSPFLSKSLTTPASALQPPSPRIIAARRQTITPRFCRSVAPPVWAMWQCHYLPVTLRFCSPRLLVSLRFSHMALSSVDFSLHRLHASSSGSHFSCSTFFCVTAYDLCGSAAVFLFCVPSFGIQQFGI